MSDVRDYVRWRGDLSFTQDPIHPADILTFCELSYIHFDHLLEDPDTPVELADAGEVFLQRPDVEEKIRSKYDPELLRLAADSRRFGQTRLCGYRDLLDPDRDTQFAAVTFLLDDGTAVITFRGTDSTVVGWKEDFNMSFQQSVPAQRLAQQYVRQVGLCFPGKIVICGHSKGGNMAVFSAARSSPMLQQQIQAVYNLDGPGFSDYLMGDPGYKTMVPRIHTFVPQSSIIGMLMDHEEPYTIIKSKQIGVLQHDIFNWEVMGPEFIPMEEITADSRFLNETIRNWAASLSNQQRNQIVDAMFDLLAQGNVEDAGEIFTARNLKNYVKILSGDEEKRKLLSDGFLVFMDAAKQTMTAVSQQKALESTPRKKGLLQKLADTTRIQAETLRLQAEALRQQSESRKAAQNEEKQLPE